MRPTLNTYKFSFFTKTAGVGTSQLIIFTGLSAKLAGVTLDVIGNWVVRATLSTNKKQGKAEKRF